MLVRRLILSGFVALLATQSAWGQHIESGPEPGSKVAPLTVFVTTGERAEATVELARERKDLPTVYLFVQNAHWSRPVARFLRDLDKELETGVANFKDGAAYGVWLAEEPTPLKEHLPRVQSSINFTKTTLSVFDGPKSGPTGWSLNDAAHLTVVIVRDGKVVKCIGYDFVNETHVPEILALLKAGG